MSRILPLLLLCLWAGLAWGAHITDKLVVGFYDEPSLEGKPSRLLTSGTPIEVLERKDGKARVRLGDGTIGWIEARYASEAKPAAMALLEAQAEIRQLKKQLQSTGKDPTKPQGRVLPSAEKTRLGLELGKARQRIEALEKQLADLPRLQAAEKERDDLAGRLQAIQQALGFPPNPGPKQQAQPSPVAQASDWRLWAGAAGLVLLGFLTGVLFVKRRISRRFRGLRL